MPYTGVDHPAIACLDVLNLAAWYCETFGMRVMAQSGGDPATRKETNCRSCRG